MKWISTPTVFYSNGFDVTVTDSAIRVKDELYELNSLQRHGISAIRPSKVPATLFLGTGAIGELIGALGILPSSPVSFSHLFNTWLNANEWCMIVSALLFAFGILWMRLCRERYALTISTLEGKRYLIVSDQRDYIRDIVNAMNRALFSRLGGLPMGLRTRIKVHA